MYIIEIQKLLDAALTNQIFTTALYYIENNFDSIRAEAIVKQLRDRDMLMLKIPFEDTHITFLHYSLIKKNNVWSKALIEAGAKLLDATDSSVPTLVFTKETCNWEIVTLLLDKGENPQLLDGRGNNLLHALISNYYTDHSFAQDKFEDYFIDFVKHGVDLFHKNQSLSSPIEMAFLKNNYSLICKLIRIGYLDIDECIKDEALIFYAMDYTDTELFELLVSKQVNTETLNKSDLTPLDLAILRGSEFHAKKLIEIGADYVHSFSRVIHSQKLSQFIFLEEFFSTEELQKIKIGFKPLLHYALSAHARAIVEHLIESKFYIDILDDFNNTPLNSAIVYQHVHLIKYFINKGANINIKNEVDESPIFRMVSFYVSNQSKQYDNKIVYSLLTKMLRQSEMTTESVKLVHEAHPKFWEHWLEKNCLSRFNREIIQNTLEERPEIKELGYIPLEETSEEIEERPSKISKVSSYVPDVNSNYIVSSRLASDIFKNLPPIPKQDETIQADKLDTLLYIEDTDTSIIGSPAYHEDPLEGIDLDF